MAIIDHRIHVTGVSARQVAQTRSIRPKATVLDALKAISSILYQTAAVITTLAALNLLQKQLPNIDRQSAISTVCASPIATITLLDGARALLATFPTEFGFNLTESERRSVLSEVLTQRIVKQVYDEGHHDLNVTSSVTSFFSELSITQLVWLIQNDAHVDLAPYVFTRQSAELSPRSYLQLLSVPLPAHASGHETQAIFQQASLAVSSCPISGQLLRALDGEAANAEAGYKTQTRVEIIPHPTQQTTLVAAPLTVHASGHEIQAKFQQASLAVSSCPISAQVPRVLDWEADAVDTEHKMDATDLSSQRTTSVRTSAPLTVQASGHETQAIFQQASLAVSSCPISAQLPPALDCKAAITKLLHEVEFVSEMAHGYTDASNPLRCEEDENILEDEQEEWGDDGSPMDV
jgi:hypothetical protein